MRSIRHRGEGAEVVDPVQVGRLERDIEPAEEEVDRVRVLGTERGGQRATDPGGGGRRTEFGVRSVEKGEWYDEQGW